MKQRKPIRKRSKNRIPALKRKLHTVWAIAIKLRDGNRCMLCGKTEHLNSHHCIVPAARGAAIRFEMMNGITLCAFCHMRVHSSTKAQLDDYIVILNSRISREDQEALEIRASKGHKFDASELEEMLDALQKVVNDAREG